LGIQQPSADCRDSKSRDVYMGNSSVQHLSHLHEYCTSGMGVYIAASSFPWSEMVASSNA